MNQGANKLNITIFHEPIVEVGMTLKCRRKSSAQFRGVVFANQPPDCGLQCILALVSPSPLLGDCYKGMSDSFPQFLRGPQVVPGSKLPVSGVKEVLRCVRVLLNQHV